MLVGSLLTALSAVIFAHCDDFLAREGYQKPYYAVHVFHNAMVASLTAGDVWAALTDFNSIFVRPIAWNAVYLCTALHAYHIYRYWRTFHRDDWLHHGLMIGMALPLGCAARSGALMGMTLFFTTGLPGGINYALLFAERNGWITKEMEKAINVPVHQWLRGPGCIATAAFMIAASQAGAWWERAAATLVAALTFWNGIYFTNQIVRADERRRLNRPTGLNRPTAEAADANNTGHIQANPMLAPVAPQ